MSTHDYIVDNQNGANFRSDLNNALAAIVSNNSSATAPTTTYAFMLWADTANDLLKQRNAADSAWISILTLSTGAPLADYADNALSGNAIDGGTISNFTSTGIDDNATSTAITIDASENVGIGVTPEAWHSNYTALQFAGNGALSGWGNQQAGAAVFLSQNASADQTNDWEYISTDEASRYEQVNGVHTFSVAPSGTADTAISFTTAMTIDNAGRVMLGTTTSTNPNAKLVIKSFSNNDAAEVRVSTNGVYGFAFFNAADSVVGSIQINSTGTAFNTSSDYRLKENVLPMAGSIDRLKALKPSRFNFKSDATLTVDGFLAHEAQSVVPECVTGIKDAMKDEEYEVTPAVMDGDTVVTEAVIGTRSVPAYQGIDQAKIVPLLVASLQEAIARIEVLENA